MKFNALLISFILCFLSITAMAGSGHSHGYSSAPVTQGEAKSIAKSVINSLVERNKIEKSWMPINATSVEKKVIKGSPEWVVVFMNDKINDDAKQKLYVFLTPSGEYIAVNYTGK